MSSWVLEMRENGRLQTALVTILAATLFIALAIWGGQPSGVNSAVFYGGVVALLLISSLFIWLGWHLLLRPLPTGYKAPNGYTMAAPYRQLIAALMAISGLSLVIGLFWDEVWHRRYGIQFGEDFFWRPHQLMYASFLITIFLSFYSLFYIMRQGSGTLQQRFRANAMLGWLVLVGGYMLFALPADPIWHEIYGVDITAWSIPHVILLLSFASIALIAAALQSSTVAARRWRPIRHWQQLDLVILGVLAVTLTIWLQVMTTDYEGLSLRLLQARPVWALPALIVSAGAFCGVLANHSLRMVGAATIVGLSNLGFRLLLLRSFEIPDMTASAWITAVFPILTLDLWYFFSYRRHQAPPHWLTAGTAASLGMALFGFMLINRFYAYPSIEGSNLISMILAVWVAGCGAAWAAQRMGDYLAKQAMSAEEGETAVFPSLLTYVPPVALTAAISFIVFFIITATPPV